MEYDYLIKFYTNDDAESGDVTNISCDHKTKDVEKAYAKGEKLVLKAFKKAGIDDVHSIESFVSGEDMRADGAKVLLEMGFTYIQDNLEDHKGDDFIQFFPEERVYLYMWIAELGNDYIGWSIFYEEEPQGVINFCIF